MICMQIMAGAIESIDTFPASRKGPVLITDGQGPSQKWKCSDSRLTRRFQRKKEFPSSVQKVQGDQGALEDEHSFRFPLPVAGLPHKHLRKRQ